MVEVVGYRLIERRQVGIDQQVVMSRIRVIDAGRRYTHVAQSEIEFQLRLNSRTILEIYEIDLRSGGRRSEPTGALGARNAHTANCNSREQQRRQNRKLAMGRYDSVENTHEDFRCSALARDKINAAP